MSLKIPGNNPNIANYVVAKVDISDLDATFGEEIAAIFEGAGNAIRSWVPGRQVNALKEIVTGNLYYITTTEDFDVSEWFEITDEAGGGGGSDTLADVVKRGSLSPLEISYSTVFPEIEYDGPLGDNRRYLTQEDVTPYFFLGTTYDLYNVGGDVIGTGILALKNANYIDFIDVNLIDGYDLSDVVQVLSKIIYSNDQSLVSKTWVEDAILQAKNQIAAATNLQKVTDAGAYTHTKMGYTDKVINWDADTDNGLIDLPALTGQFNTDMSGADLFQEGRPLSLAGNATDEAGNPHFGGVAAVITSLDYSSHLTVHFAIIDPVNIPADYIGAATFDAIAVTEPTPTTFNNSDIPSIDGIRKRFGARKRYEFLITQSGTLDPIVTVLFNDLDQGIFWNYSAEGELYANSPDSAFTLEKTGFQNQCFYSHTTDTMVCFSLNTESVTNDRCTFDVRRFDNSGIDGVLTNIYGRIEVFD